MDVPVAEVCRPLRRSVISPGLFGIMHDYVKILADAKYSEKKEEIRMKVDEQGGIFNFLKFHKMLRREKPRIRRECFVDAGRQIHYVLKKYGIGVEKKIEYDELVINKERLGEAPGILEEMVANMDELLLKNRASSFFRINSYLDFFSENSNRTIPFDAYKKLKEAKEK